MLVKEKQPSRALSGEHASPTDHTNAPPSILPSSAEMDTAEPFVVPRRTNDTPKKACKVITALGEDKVAAGTASSERAIQ